MRRIPRRRRPDLLHAPQVVEVLAPRAAAGEIRVVRRVGGLDDIVRFTILDRRIGGIGARHRFEIAAPAHVKDVDPAEIGHQGSTRCALLAQREAQRHLLLARQRVGARPGMSFCANARNSGRVALTANRWLSASSWLPDMISPSGCCRASAHDTHAFAASARALIPDGVVLCARATPPCRLEARPEWCVRER
jgi:hypothetical protein